MAAKFKIGDRVRFVNPIDESTLDGTVTDVENDGEQYVVAFDLGGGVTAIADWLTLL